MSYSLRSKNNPEDNERDADRSGDSASEAGSRSTRRSTTDESFRRLRRALAEQTGRARAFEEQVVRLTSEISRNQGPRESGPSQAVAEPGARPGTEARPVPAATDSDRGPAGDAGPPHPAGDASNRQGGQGGAAVPPHPAADASNRPGGPAADAGPPHPAGDASNRYGGPAADFGPPQPAGDASNRYGGPAADVGPPHPAGDASNRYGGPAADVGPPHPAGDASSRYRGPAADAGPPRPAGDASNRQGHAGNNGLPYHDVARGYNRNYAVDAELRDYAVDGDRQRGYADHREERGYPEAPRAPLQRAEGVWRPPTGPGQHPEAPEGPATYHETDEIRQRRTQEWVNQADDPMTQMSMVFAEAMRRGFNTANSQRTSEEGNRVDAFIARQTGAKDLPVFSGDPLEWITFKGQFEQSTAMCGLTPPENLLRLQRALKGRARDAVAALLLSPANVAEIIATLEMRFGRHDIIIEAMLSKVRKTQRLTEASTMEALVEYSVSIRNVAATLRGIDTEALTSASLLAEIVQKLPLSLRLIWLHDRRDQEGRPSLEDLGTWLMKLCGGAALNGCLEAPKQQRPRREDVLLQVAEPSRGSGKCTLCNRNHQVVACPDYLKKSVQQRWDWVTSNRVCFVCLDSGHRVIECKKNKCGVEDCRRPHHRTLHLARNDAAPRDNVAPAVVLATAEKDAERPVLLKVIPVTLCGPDGQIDTHALLDEGSTVTLIEDNLARSIGAEGPVSGIRIHGASDMCAADAASRRVSLGIRGDGAEYKIRANTLRSLRLPRQPIGGAGSARGVLPRLLIGQDNAHLIVSREVREVDNGWIRSRTALGWVVHGGNAVMQSVALSLTAEKDRNIEEIVKTNFALESLGVTATPRAVTKQCERALEIMRATTHPLPGGRWETGLLWAQEAVCLPNNRECAVNRLRSLERKLSRDGELATQYAAKINDYITKGYAVRATPEELARPAARRWYLPHFSVVNPRKPGKIRVVFDAASRCRGAALNDHLLTGPDMLTSLLGNIIRFREGPIAMAADIKEMFLRIQIRPADQEAQLFLWRDDPAEEPTTYRMKAMLFGAKCSPSSAQYVRDRVAGAHAARYPAAAAAITQKFYMDDYLDAVGDANEAIALMRDVTHVLSDGGFELTNWASNEPRVMQAIPADKRAQAAISIADHPTERVLGVKWEPRTDLFTFAEEAVLDEAAVHPTKREFLSAVMRVFDPAGFIGCLTIRGKILLQEIWRSGVSWDEKISDEHAYRWRALSTHIYRGRYVIPRCSVRDKNNKFILHVLCDASEVACCAVAYLVEESTEGRKTAFIASKCKVAPLKPVSIPRLELQAALMGARLAKTVRKESTVQINKSVFWTDSTTVLCWLRSDPRTYSTFVANRLGEIDELTSIEDWRWVPTKMNTADIGTRDGDEPDMTIAGPWYSGPAFLTKPEAEWPREKSAIARPDDTLMEVKARFVGLTSAGSTLPNPQRFSSWLRLIRTTAWVMRFVARCRRREAAQGPSLCAEEVHAAVQLWTKLAQGESFGREIAAIRAGRALEPDSRLRDLTPVLDEKGILRMGTRLLVLERNDSGVSAPIILDGAHKYTALLIRHQHIAAGHASVEKVVARLRQEYHILRLRGSVKKATFNCNSCRIRRAHPQIPLMGQLPAARLAVGCPVFTHCGLDFFGPMIVTVGRRREKRYGVLFTCLTTRAVHLELAASLSADSTISAIRRMTARRGEPRVFYSDNGTNFHGADREIKEAVTALENSVPLQDELASRQIRWQFNPPAAPHMGGAWERLVRSVKAALQITLRERAPQEETLRTALAEAEHTVNSRPLTHVSVDPRDEEPLTPNHFLIGSAGHRLHLAHYAALDDNVCLRKQWRIAQQLADMFWRRWVREYLPTLARRQKWQHAVPPLQPGDLVVVAETGAPRNTWTRGRILRTFPGKDGQVRTVEVQTAAGTYVRPATKIAAFPPLDPEAFDEEGAATASRGEDVSNA